MKKTLLILTTCYLLISFGIYSQVAVEPLAGEGTQESPFEIQSWQNLYWLSQNPSEWDNHYIVTSDIDFGEAVPAIHEWAEGKGWEPIGIYVDEENPLNNPFTGSFNGQGFSVSGLYINRPDADFLGLFGFTQNGTISDLSVINVEYTGSRAVGGLVGWNKGIIINSFTEGVVNGFGETWGTGGLAGWNDGTISSSGATVKVSGFEAVGGLVGDNFEGTISNSYALGDASGTNWGVGGLVGSSYGEVSQSYAAGSVKGIGSIGGLIGESSGTVINSFATGNVTDADWGSGGLVGASYAPIINSYATGNVQGLDAVGGLVGENTGSIANSYSRGVVTGTVNTGGLVGRNSATDITSSFYSAASGQSDSGKGESLSIDEMTSYATFFSSLWDFIGEEINGVENVWGIDETGADNEGFPFLSWQNFEHKVYAKVTTHEITDVTSITATGNGTIIEYGYPAPVQYGHVWSTTENPDLGNDKTVDDSITETGSYTSQISDLLPDVTYYVRAYVTNETGTTYGDQIAFTTNALEGTQQLLTIDINGVGEVYLDGQLYSEAMVVDEGTILSFNAVPGDDFIFINWSDDEGNEVSSDKIFDYTMPGNDVVITANFSVLVGMNRQNVSDIRFFPNPAIDYLYIQSNFLIDKVLIINITGQIVYYNASISGDTYRVALSDIDPGVYIVRITSGDGVVSRKIQVVK